MPPDSPTSAPPGRAVAFTPPPPPPPSKAGARKPLRLRYLQVGRSRLAGAVTELAVAAAILATVVAVSSSGGPSARAARSDAAAYWAIRGVPAITALVDDLAAVGRPTGAATAPASAALARDLAQASALPAPPDRAAATAWSSSLALLADAVDRLRGVPPQAGTASAAALTSELQQAGEQLLLLGTYANS